MAPELQGVSAGSGDQLPTGPTTPFRDNVPAFQARLGAARALGAAPILMVLLGVVHSAKMLYVAGAGCSNAAGTGRTGQKQKKHNSEIRL